MNEPGTEDGVTPNNIQAPEKSPRSIMQSVAEKHNELERKAYGAGAFSINTGGGLDLALTDTGNNEHLAIETTSGNSSSYAHIAHYDPGLQEFLFYPELVTDGEKAVLEGLAKSKRDEAVRTNLRNDYDAKIVRDLHKKHRDVLAKDGLVGRIAERYNGLPAQDKLAGTQEILIDGSTSYFVSLTPKLGGIDRKDPQATQAENVFMTPEAFISISLTGDCFMKNGVRLRRGSAYIHLAHLELDGPEGRYVPDSRLVTEEEFAQILELAKELQRLKTTVPSLDAELVALKR